MYVGQEWDRVGGHTLSQPGQRGIPEECVAGLLGIPGEDGGDRGAGGSQGCVASSDGLDKAFESRCDHQGVLHRARLPIKS